MLNANGGHLLVRASWFGMLRLHQPLIERARVTTLDLYYFKFKKTDWVKNRQQKKKLKTIVFWIYTSEINGWSLKKSPKLKRRNIFPLSIFFAGSIPIFQGVWRGFQEFSRMGKCDEFDPCIESYCPQENAEKGGTSPWSSWWDSDHHKWLMKPKLPS